MHGRRGTPIGVTVTLVTLALAQCRRDCPAGALEEYEQCVTLKPHAGDVDSGQGGSGGDGGTPEREGGLHTDGGSVPSGGAGDSAPQPDGPRCASKSLSSDDCLPPTIFVDAGPAGSDDNDGSLERPLKSFHAAMNAARPGQTVFFQPGTWSLRTRLHYRRRRAESLDLGGALTAQDGRRAEETRGTAATTCAKKVQFLNILWCSGLTAALKVQFLNIYCPSERVHRRGTRLCQNACDAPASTSWARVVSGSIHRT